MSQCLCGARLAPAGAEAPLGMTMCATCAARGAFLANEEAPRTSVVSGALAGLLAAVLAAVAWYGVVAASGFQIGLIAVAVGWFVAQAVVVGGRGGGTGMQGVAMLLTLASMVVSEYLISWHFAKDFFAAEGFAAPPLVMPVADTVAVVGESLSADPLTLVFWLIALAAAWKVAGAPASR